MDTLLGLIFFASIIAAAVLLVRWIMAKIRHGQTNHQLRSISLLLAVAFITALVAGTAFPTEQTSKEADTATTSTSKQSNSEKASSSSKKKATPKKTESTKESKAKQAKTKANSKKTKKQAKTKKKTYDFSRVKLGMTKSEIVKAIGKPDSDTSGTLSYGDDYLMLNNDGKLFSGSPAAIQKQINAKNQSKKESSSNKSSQLKSFAKAFGQKDVQTLQKYVGSAYSSTETPAGMAYGWKTDYGMLYRLDDSETGITHVYKDGLGDKGTELYTGQTIKQKPRVQYRYMY